MDKEFAKDIIEENKKIIEAELDNMYEELDPKNTLLAEAQKYSLMMGGKRIRPCLCLETAKMFGGDVYSALPFAKALEMVHNYSLIHDDLPCMDNDELRRGMPTTHKKYNEAIAILAGDGLLTDAFLICSANPYVSKEGVVSAIQCLSASAGSFVGMVRGQSIDLWGEKNPLTLEDLIQLHGAKTGALIEASVQLGCIAAGVSPDSPQMSDMSAFAQNIGLTFQIVDDILDVTSTTEKLGKPVGSDSQQNKTTFMSFFTPEEAWEEARKYTEEAIEIVSQYPNSERLVAIAEYLCSREM